MFSRLIQIGYTSLADRYANYLSYLASTAQTVFWDGDGQVYFDQENLTLLRFALYQTL